MYIYIYVCLYIYIYIHIYTCIYIYTHADTNSGGRAQNLTQFIILNTMIKGLIEVHPFPRERVLY